MPLKKIHEDIKIGKNKRGRAVLAGGPNEMEALKIGNNVNDAHNANDTYFKCENGCSGEYIVETSVRQQCVMCGRIFADGDPDEVD